MVGELNGQGMGSGIGARVLVPPPSTSSPNTLKWSGRHSQSPTLYKSTTSPLPRSLLESKAMGGWEISRGQ